MLFQESGVILALSLHYASHSYLLSLFLYELPNIIIFFSLKKNISKKFIELLSLAWYSALSPLASNLTFSEADIAPMLQAMTNEGLISATEIEHYDDIEKFVQEVDPPSPPETELTPESPTESKLTFRQMVEIKARELEKEFPIYDPDIEAKLDAHIEKLMQRLEALHDEN